MSETPEIVEERPPYDATWDENGLRAGRAFTVVAYSEIEALLKLASAKDVRRGSVYRDHRGNIPDSFSRCFALHTAGKPHAIANAKGIYRIVADYRRNDGGSEEPKKGGPKVFIVRGTLESRPVDHDIFGKPIQNPVEEPLDPPITTLLPDERLIARWWVEGTDNVAAAAAFRPVRGRVNETDFLGAPKGSILCHGVHVSPPEDDGWMLHETEFQYREPVTLNSIEAYYTQDPGPKKPVPGEVGWAKIQPPIEGWAEIRLARGRRKLVGSFLDPISVRYKRLTTQEGVPLNSPVPIDINGNEILDGKLYALVYYVKRYHDLKKAFS